MLTPPLIHRCIDYLGLVAAFSDAICRRRELRHPAEFAPLVSGASEGSWSVESRFDLYTKLKLWSSHGAGDSIKKAEETELQARGPPSSRLIFPWPPLLIFP